ncbi:hypothetical protein pdam_00015679 [Pocillopora damicornis]|uniref:Protein eyes shut homolog n=1 Tax=Pocillopora damicornis TaxID=46731 RepID=A0A3M6TZA4_POCDA|nr:hypothetical protein pdam_00015679 [Pocillopora damicornis]
MLPSSLHFDFRRMVYILPLLWVVVLRLSVVHAQNDSSIVSNSLCILQCPSGHHCFNNTVVTTVIELGHNGHICTTAGECYGESDPLGFLPGPRQKPQTVVYGDTVVIKPKEIGVNFLNVSRDTFHNCDSGGQLFQNFTSSQFQIPSKYLTPPGIKYFIAKDDVFSCSFGIRLELYVRSRQQPNCTNPALPNLGVCSGVGLCSSASQTFFTRDYTCVCCDAYKGRYCEELDSCHPSRNPCKNGATCTDIKDGIADSFNCTCIPGYTGTFCETNIDECSSSPCVNGFCVDYINAYSCLCDPGFNGPNCHVAIPDLCANNPCKNGGSCERSGTKRQNYTCTCLPDFTGRNCTENVTRSSSLSTSTMLAITSISTIVFPTSFIGNFSFVMQSVSSSVVHATRLSSSVPKSLSQGSTMITGTSVVGTLLPTGSQRISSLPGSVISSTEIEIAPSPSISSLTFPQSVLSTAINSSVEGISTSNVYESSLEAFSTSVGTFSPAGPSMQTRNNTVSSVTKSNAIMESVVTKSSLAPSLYLTSSLHLTSSMYVSASNIGPVSSFSSSLPASQAVTLIIALSRSTSTLLGPDASLLSSVLASSQAVTPTIAISRGTSTPSGPDASLSSSLLVSSLTVTPTIAISRSTSTLLGPYASSSTSTPLEPDVSLSSSLLASSLVVTPTIALSRSTLTPLGPDVSLSSSFLASSLAVMPTTVLSRSTSTLLGPDASFSSSSSILLLTSSQAVTPTVIFSGNTSTSSAPSMASHFEVTTPLAITTGLPSMSTVSFRSTTAISSSMSTSFVSSSVVPTMPPIPTTVPLINQTCVHNPCNNGTCFSEPYLQFEFRCECSYPTVGPVCRGVAESDLHFPAFGKNSFLEHKSISFNNEINRIDITFKTNASEGLLLFAADSKKRGDFIQLHVTGGKLEFRFDPGDSLVYIQSNQRVDTGEIITATVTYDSSSSPPFGTLQVNNGAQLIGVVKGRLRGIQLYNNWYVGGVPQGFDMRSETRGNSAPSTSFVGSIRDVQVNGETINLSDAENWFNINEGDMPACQRMPCQNNGKCTEVDGNVLDYECNCTADYEGRNCEVHKACKSENCNGGECIPKESNPNDFICLCPLGRVGVQCQTVIDITVPLFTIVQGFPSYLEYPVPKDAVNSFHVTFLFKLDNSSKSWNDSLLVYSAQNSFVGSGDDFFAIGLKDNKVLLQYNVGSGSAKIYSEPVDMRREWHVVVAGRDGRQGWLYVDTQPRKEGESPAPLVGLNLFEPLYIGGIPNTRQLPSTLEFKTGGFHGSIYDVGIRFAKGTSFIKLSTSTGMADAANDWAVVKGRNVGNESYNECNTLNPPCFNGGNCTQEGATFICSCPAEWTGLYCGNQRLPCYGYSPCVSGSCRPDGLNTICDCPLGKTGQFCSQDIIIQTPRFQNFSYMMFAKTNIRSTTQITIRFKPETLDGILFYVSHEEQSTTGDFLSIILHNGFVKLRYDLGKGVGEAVSNVTVSLNTWYTVKAIRNAQNGSLAINDGNPVYVTSPGSAVALDVNGILYFQPNTAPVEGRNIANCPEQQVA